MNYCRYLYKGFSFSVVILKSYVYTLVFKIKMRANCIEFGHVRCFNSAPSLLVNRKCKSFIIGNNVLFNSYTDHSWYCKCKFLVRENAILKIGDNTGLNGVMIYCSHSIQIGKFVNIGGGTRIFDTDHHSLNWKERRNPELNVNVKSAPIIIGDDVFIGANCMIMKGVVIGNRSIIAAGSVVTTSIPEDEVWGGNPAHFIKKCLC